MFVSLPTISGYSTSNRRKKRTMHHLYIVSDIACLINLRPLNTKHDFQAFSAKTTVRYRWVGNVALILTRILWL